jgi:hypothetical protein
MVQREGRVQALGGGEVAETVYGAPECQERERERGRRNEGGEMRMIWMEEKGGWGDETEIRG